MASIRNAAARGRRRARALVLLCVALLPAGAGWAQARPVTTYRGTIGDQPVELALVHDWQLDGMSGYLAEGVQGEPVPLEKTPYAEDTTLMLNVLRTPRLPTSTLVLQPAPPGARHLRGRSIDLRSRESEPVALERVARFSSDPRTGYDGELLQRGADPRFLFRVHARRKRGEHGGRVHAITVVDRASGTPAQVIDGLDLVFSGGDTLSLEDINGDGVLDFSVMPARSAGGSGSAGHPHYYLYRASGGYGRDAQLEALAARGALRFGAGGSVSLRPSAGIDYRAGTIEWSHYRYVTPTQLELVNHTVERF